MSAEHKIKTFLLFAFIFINAYSQCTGTAISPQYIITGIMQLGLPTQSYAQQQYNVVFNSSDQLGTSANIFSAFGILYLI